MGLEKLNNKFIEKLGKELSENNYTNYDKRLGGWSLIADNPGMYTYTVGAVGGITGQTYKTRHICAHDNVSNVILVYANFAPIFPNGGINPNFNSINVGAAIENGGLNGQINTCSFKHGRIKAALNTLSLLYTEPVFLSLNKGDEFFVRSYINSILSPAPPAPVLSSSDSGGTLRASNSYYVCIAYEFPNGDISFCSAGVLLATSSGSNTKTIVVTSPASLPGALGYVCYMTGVGDNINGVYSRATDLIPFGVNAVISRENNVNSHQYVRQGSFSSIIGGNSGVGGLNFDGLGTNEGIANGDATVANTNELMQVQSVSNVLMPLAILGKTLEYRPTVGLIGDSIKAGAGDHGYKYQSGGFSTRAINDQFSLMYDISKSPLYGHVRVPLGGEQAAQFANTLATGNRFSRTRINVTELASNVISNYGTNDLSLGLSSMKDSILKIAKYYTDRGIKFFQCTLFPKTSSTDGWRTANNQTVFAVEGVRVAFNGWLRDMGPSGFISQADAPGLVDIIDVCLYIEVNSTNVLTLNGGFWRANTDFTPISGTLTSVNSAVQFSDSIKSFTRNQYKGYSLIFTSGTLNNIARCIGWNNTNTMNVYDNAFGIPAVGTSYIITLNPTVDGIHPSSWGHLLGAQAVQESLHKLI